MQSAVLRFGQRSRCIAENCSNSAAYIERTNDNPELKVILAFSSGLFYIWYGKQIRHQEHARRHYAPIEYHTVWRL